MVRPQLPLGIVSPLCTQSADIARVLGVGVHTQRDLIGVEKPLGSHRFCFIYSFVYHGLFERFDNAQCMMALYINIDYLYIRIHFGSKSWHSWFPFYFHLLCVYYDVCLYAFQNVCNGEQMMKMLIFFCVFHDADICRYNVILNLSFCKQFWIPHVFFAK